MSGAKAQSTQSRGDGTTSLPLAVLPVAVGVVCAVVLYWDVFLWWREAWTTEGYFCTHGPLIPLVSAYLTWMRITESKPVSGHVAQETRLGDWLPGLVIVVLACIVQLLSLRLDVRVASGLSFVALCFGMVWLVWGREWARRLAFPISFLVFMIPAPFVANALTVPLQHRSASVAAMVGGALGMVVERDGLVLSLPNYTFEVAPTCSGINSLFSIVPLALLFASMQEATRWQKLLLVVASVPIALMANTLRIVLTLVLATFFGEQAAEGFFHSMSGLVLFGAALGGLCVVARVVTEHRPEEASAPA